MTDAPETEVTMPNTEQPQDSLSKNNLSGLHFNGRTLQWRDIIYVVSLTVTLIGVYFAVKFGINENERSIADLYSKYTDLARIIDKQYELLDKELKRIDDNGTKRSHESDSTQQQQIDYNKQRIDDNSRQLRDLAPRLDKVDTNVLWLMSRQIEHK